MIIFIYDKKNFTYYLPTWYLLRYIHINTIEYFPVTIG